MKFNRDLLKKLSYLSRLEFEDRGANRLVRELNQIVSCFDKLKTVGGKRSHREAVSLSSLPRRKSRSNKEVAEVILNNAPSREGRYIRIKSLFGRGQ